MTCGRRDGKDVAWSGQQWQIGKDPWEGDDETGWYGDCKQLIVFWSLSGKLGCTDIRP